MPDLLAWIIVFICLLLSFFFSCCETALSCCNKIKMRVLSDDGNKRASLVLKILDLYDRSLTTVLVGNNIVAVAISAVSTILFTKYLASTSVAMYASFICSIVVSFVVYILGDTLPKTIAKAIPDTMCLSFGHLIYFFMYLFYPIAVIFEGITKLIEKIFKIKESNDLSSEDFESAIEKASEAETIEEEQAEIVQSTLDFLDTKVKEVLTPFEKMVMLDLNGLTYRKLEKFFIENNFSRIPIYQKDRNNIVGVIVEKVFFEIFAKDPHASISSTMIQPYFVNKDVMIDDLFEGFKRHHTHIAFVKENEKIIGMVTMDDILEEIVDGIDEKLPDIKGEIK